MAARSRRTVHKETQRQAEAREKKLARLARKAEKRAGKLSHRTTITERQQEQRP